MADDVQRGDTAGAGPCSGVDGNRNRCGASRFGIAASRHGRPGLRHDPGVARRFPGEVERTCGDRSGRGSRRVRTGRVRHSRHPRGADRSHQKCQPPIPFAEWLGNPAGWIAFRAGSLGCDGPARPDAAHSEVALPDRIPGDRGSCVGAAFPVRGSRGAKANRNRRLAAVRIAGYAAIPGR